MREVAAVTKLCIVQRDQRQQLEPNSVVAVIVRFVAGLRHLGLFVVGGTGGHSALVSACIGLFRVLRINPRVEMNRGRGGETSGIPATSFQQSEVMYTILTVAGVLAGPT